MAVMEGLADVAGEACGKLEKEIRKLKQEVAALRADLTIMRVLAQGRKCFRRRLRYITARQKCRLILSCRKPMLPTSSRR